MSRTATSIIGSSRAQAGTHRFRAVNPASGQELETDFARATHEDVDRAAELAGQAFESYGVLSGTRRAGFLRSIAKKLEQGAAAIVERGNLETALPVPRLQSELARTCFQLRFFADIAQDGTWADARIDHGDPQRRPMPKPDLRSVMRPLGPVAIFGASNFPIAFSVAGGDTASALAAGNPVIVKAHPAHPGTSEIAGLMIQEAVCDAGLPAGVFSLLFDDGIDVGAMLVRHPRVKAVGFTGSRRAGQALTELAAARPEPIPVYAEMSSVNPLFILPGALRQRGGDIARGVHGSVTLGNGQFCTNPGLILVENGAELSQFIETLAGLMSGTQPGPMLTAGISRNYRQGVDRLASSGGVHTLAKVSSPPESNAAGAALFRTTARSFLKEGILMEEVFGPSTLVIECDNSGELRSAALALEGQLTACIHGTEDDLAAHRDLIEILATRAGRLIFNGFPTGVEVSQAMVHGGPFPATSDGRSTSVGGRAIARFARPVCFQDFPDAALPDELRESNPLGLWRMVDSSPGRH